MILASRYDTSRSGDFYADRQIALPLAHARGEQPMVATRDQVQSLLLKLQKLCMTTEQWLPKAICE